MRHLTYLLLVVLALEVLPGCGKKEEATTAVTVELEKQRERADREQRAKEEEQKKREVAEQRADFWKTIVWVVVITGVVFTLVGVALGSSARKKADRGRPNE